MMLYYPLCGLEVHPKTELGVSVWVWSSSTESTTSKSKNHGGGGAFLGRGYFGVPTPKTPKKGVFGGPKTPKMAKNGKNASMSGLVHLLLPFFQKSVFDKRGGGVLSGTRLRGVPQRFFVNHIRLPSRTKPTPTPLVLFLCGPIATYT